MVVMESNTQKRQCGGSVLAISSVKRFEAFWFLALINL